MSREELISRLARLDARDRAWLLGELPAALRRELLSELRSEEPAAALQPSEPTKSGWESLDAARVAEVLGVEPAWLASAATRDCEPRWRERMLAALSHRQRHDIEFADRTGRALNARAARQLLDTCRERLATGAPPAMRAPRQGFAALVEQMKARFA